MRIVGAKGILIWLTFGLVFAVSRGPLTGSDRVYLTEWANDPWIGQPVPSPWILKTNYGRADVSRVTENGVRALRLYSRISSFSVESKLRLQLADYPFISWRWRVTTLPEKGDFRVRKKDDQAAQLFVMFGRSKVIVYLWDSTAPVGTVARLPSPPFMTIWGMVVRSGAADLGVWLEEKRNLPDDYRKTFGKDPPAQIRGVRIQINSQHTGTVAESFFADLYLSRDSS